MKNSFIYRQYRGTWEEKEGIYNAILESKLLQVFPKVEIHYNIYFSSLTEDDLWDEIASKVNALEAIEYEYE